MNVVTKDFDPELPTILIDLSWLMYRSRYAMYQLSIPSEEGPVPTGHLHGAMTSILNVAPYAPQVILAVDSLSDRKAIFSGYKEGRRPKKGNFFDDFPIRSHTPQLLAMASCIPNVWFIKKEGYEADDLINSVTESGIAPAIYGTDNDLFMSRKPYGVFTEVSDKGPQFMDMEAYLLQKYKLAGFEFLPIWYKVVRGDSSDNLSAGAPRYPSKLLARLCTELKDANDWEAFRAWIAKEKDAKLMENLDVLRRNFDIVKPRIVPLEKLVCKKLTEADALGIASEFQLLSVMAALQWFPGSVFS